jgi:hypothetical protein
MSGHPRGPAANDGMHPTANSAAFIRKAWHLDSLMRGGDAGIMQQVSTGGRLRFRDD